MKPYQQILIRDCGESLVPIPLEKFAVELPHPYQKLGAPYGAKSPYYLRQGVLDALIQSQSYLQQLHSNWRIQIFDAYRPAAVQQFMVDYTFAKVLRERGLNTANLSTRQRQELWQEVYQIWAIPSFDPKTPPPHSTGAAVDITLVNEKGQPLNMGSAIDELSPRSHPDYYAKSSQDKEQQYHAHRKLLQDVMLKGGFRRHPREWWHFSQGDQLWAWQYNLDNPAKKAIARYGGGSIPFS